MPRNYSLTTIKALYAEADSCAYPGCNEPLVLRERGLVTVVSDIAHIRSEVPGGPRYDPSYMGDVDGLENLLLLCIKHHRPVDRHEAAYSVTELESWKETQRASRGPGTQVSDAALRVYNRLTSEERQAMAGIARQAERVRLACIQCQDAMEEVLTAAEQARLAAFARMGTMYEVDAEGNRSPSRVEKFHLSGVERSEWDRKVREERDKVLPIVGDARTRLYEEIAVLRMMIPSLGAQLDAVTDGVDDMALSIGDRPGLELRSEIVKAAIALMWNVATGEIVLGDK